MTKQIDGQLEIDSDRGVIYFHSKESGTTPLRICNLSLLTADFEFLDITFGLDRALADTHLVKPKRKLL